MKTENGTPSSALPSASPRAADAIVRSVELQIVSGDLADGATLPAERDLMQQFNASRTVVREAITVLTGRGLIENRPRYRPIVRKPGYNTLLDVMADVTRLLLEEQSGLKNLYESRVFVERILVREAATNARKNDIANLTAALSRNKQSLDDSAAFYRTDTDFHAVLYQIPGNPIFPALHEAYKVWLHPHWEKMPRSPERNYVNYCSHASIHAAIVDRDPDTAEKELVNHLNSAWEYVRATFDTPSTKTTSR